MNKTIITGHTMDKVSSYSRKGFSYMVIMQLMNTIQGNMYSRDGLQNQVLLFPEIAEEYSIADVKSILYN